MHTVFVIALIVIVGALVLSWLVRRFSSTLGSQLSLFAGLVGRIGVIIAMVYSTVQVLRHGGWFIALAVLFVLIAAGAVVTGGITAAALWMSLTGRLRD
jgi:hypothetical protein